MVNLVLTHLLGIADLNFWTSNSFNSNQIDNIKVLHVEELLSVPFTFFSTF